MITDYGLQMMGFQPIPSGTVIEAKFMSLNIYEAKGINLVKGKIGAKPKTITGKVESVSENLIFVIGTSVNKCCKALTGESFCENEAKWRSENKSNPPYLLVLSKLPGPATCTKGHWIDEQDIITTHDCFSIPKQQLVKEEATKTSVLVTSLTVMLSSQDHLVTFFPICREVFAETNLGKTLRDVTVTFSGEVTVSRSLTVQKLGKKQAAAISKFNDIHPKVGYFFDLALKEKDRLKAYIYFFLVIEIFTHQTYQSLNHQTIVDALHIIPEKVKVSGTRLLLDQQKDYRSLLPRFIFCAMAKWKEIDDADIDNFLLLKKARDRIYHGEEISDKSLPIPKARSLALKLLSSK